MTRNHRLFWGGVAVCAALCCVVLFASAERRRGEETDEGDPPPSAEEVAPEAPDEAGACLPVFASDNPFISSGFGYREDPLGGDDGYMRLHRGVDIAEPVGAPVRAVRRGVVAECWPAPNGYYDGHPVYGGMLVVYHGDGMYTLYGHLSSTTVIEDDWVDCGQVIGAIGDTGKSTGPHLHFEVVVDPLRLLGLNQ